MSNAYDAYRFDRNQADQQHLCRKPSSSDINQHVMKWAHKYKKSVYDVPVDNDVQDWVEKYIQGDFMRKTGDFDLTSKLIQKLQQYRLAPSDYQALFRGVHFDISNLSFLMTHKLEDVQDGQVVTIKYESPSSWSFNYNLAERFAMVGDFNYVLVCEDIDYKHVLIDTRLFPETCRIRGRALQDEVIMLPGEYRCRVFFPKGYHKNFLMRSVNLPALQQLQDFFQDIKQQQTMKINPQPGRSGYVGGSRGGLLGEAIVLTPEFGDDDDEDAQMEIHFVWDIIDNPNSADLYILKYGIHMILKGVKDGSYVTLEASQKDRASTIKRLNRISPLRFSSTPNASFQQVGSYYETEEEQAIWESHECQVEQGVSNENYHYCIKVVTSDKFVGTLEQIAEKMMSTIDKLYKYLNSQ
jgi:hypothetical protein